jgi:hypothetical protein
MNALQMDHDACHPEPRRRPGTSQTRTTPRDAPPALLENERVFAGSLAPLGMTARRRYEIFR